MLASPDLLQNYACQPILASSLRPEASLTLRRAALNIIYELLKADEEKLGVQQDKKEEAQKKGRKKNAASKSEPISVVNGEQDSITLTSSLVQVNPTRAVFSPSRNAFALFKASVHDAERKSFTYFEPRIPASCSGISTDMINDNGLAQALQKHYAL